ncbi:MAG TPA: choice-of-anchor Q domain-containing protein [Candidatus Eisenbacteria bacterium]|nr:choice-of-anchor Q domain-containing protein [Candidatus Eisenbacteria bacterium]
MPFRLLVGLLVLVCAMPAVARTRLRDCKQVCAPAIQTCIDGGGRARKCKRTVLRSCRKNGLSVCTKPQSVGTFATAPGGVDVAGCGTFDSPCATIQYVVDNLIPRGTAATIKVGVGVFDGQTPCDAGTGADHAVVCVVDKYATILGGFVPPNWDTPTGDPSDTVIDAQGQGRGVVAVHSGPTHPAAGIEMDGLTIQNGMAHGQAGTSVAQTWAFGGGMLSGTCPVTLRNMIFRNNTAVGGTTSQADGGRGSGGGLALTGTPGTTSPATLTNVTFDANTVHGGDGQEAGGYALGGAMITFGYGVSADGLVFTNNTATGGNSNGDGTAGTDKADALGGAVAIEVDSSADLRHVTASGNVAMGGNALNGDGGGAFGGAFFAELGTLTLTDAALVGNLAHGGDGTNSVGDSSIAQGGAMMATMTALTLDRVAFVDNEARGGNGAAYGGISEGGGVAIAIGSRDGVDLPFTIRNSVMASNRVSVGSGTLAGGGGGAMWIQGATGTVEHATIADNHLGEPHLLGGGVGILPLNGFQTRAAFNNCIFANHNSPATQPGVYTNAALWVAQNATADVTRVLFANNIHDSNAGIWDVLNVPSGTINLSGVVTAPNAGFVSSGDPDNDYHLAAGSPAVNQAGPSGVAVDLDGAARPSGPSPDLGAYEFTP